MRGLILCLLLSGCATDGILVPKTVNVPTPVPCIPAEKVPEKPPVRSEDTLWAMDEYHRTIAAYSDLKLLRDVYLPQAQALLDGCSRLNTGH